MTALRKMIDSIRGLFGRKQSSAQAQTQQRSSRTPATKRNRSGKRKPSRKR
jgi:hypothetical protein